MEGERAAELRENYPEALCISATQKKGLEELAQGIIDRIDWTSSTEHPVLENIQEEMNG